MSYKVGDKVRIVGNRTGHGYGIGHIGVITEYENEDGFRVGPKDGANWCSARDVELVLDTVTTIQVGGKYTVNGYTWECMFIKGDIAWICTDTGNAAYRWNIKTGLSIDLPPEYNINLASKPVRKTVEWECHWDEHNDGIWADHTTELNCHNANITLDTLDGVPQWDTIKAEGV